MKYDLIYEKNNYNIDYSDIDDDEDSPSKKDDKNKMPEAPKEIKHLSRTDVYLIINIIRSKLKAFPRLSKCCEFIELNTNDKYDEDGYYTTPFSLYFKDDAESYLKVIEGDVWSGYPSFNSDGSEKYAEDKQKFIRAVNEELEEKKIKARFMSEGSGTSISFGLKSKKEK